MADKAPVIRTLLGEYGDKTYFWNVTSDSLEWSVPSPRDAVRAPAGYRILAADYSQIEVKIMAYASADPVLIEAINSGQDVHSFNATKVFGQRYAFTYDEMERARHEVAHVRHNELSLIRSRIKTVTFGVPYGAGKARVAMMTGMTEDEAQEFIDTFFSTFRVLKQWLDEQGLLAIDRGYSTTSVLGRKRFYLLPAVTDPEADAQLKQIKRWAGNFPIQGCVTGATRVFVQGEGRRTLADCVGRTLTLWDGIRWVSGQVVSSGLKRLYRVTLMNGQTLECSPDHRFLVASVKNTQAFYTAEELKSKCALTSRPNWRVVLSEAVPAWVYPVVIPEAPAGGSHNAKNECLRQFTDLVELGEFLGRLASNGSVRPPVSSAGGVVELLCAQHEQELLPRLEQLMARLGPATTDCDLREERFRKDGTGYDRFYSVRLCSSSVARQLATLGIKTQIPAFVWSDRTLLAAYLRGLFDGDGTVHPDGAILTWGVQRPTNAEWASQVQEALLLFGIRSRRRVYASSIRLQVQKYDMPRFASAIGFMKASKQQQANAVQPDLRIGMGGSTGQAAYGRAVLIRSVEDLGIEVPMFDVVNTDSGQFVANGMVTHNSNADILKIAMKKFYLAVRGGSFIAPKLYDVRIIMVVHDEMVTLCKEEHVAAVKPIMAQTMNEAYYEYTPKVGDPRHVLLGGVRDAVTGQVVDQGIQVVDAEIWSKA